VSSGYAALDVIHILEGRSEDLFLIGAMRTPEKAIHSCLLGANALREYVELVGRFRLPWKRAGDDDHQRQYGSYAKSVTHMWSCSVLKHIGPEKVEHGDE
jgi:hypothetical protein